MNNLVARQTCFWYHYQHQRLSVFGCFFLNFCFIFRTDYTVLKKVMENNGDPSVKLIRELRAEIERLRNSNENTNLLLLTDSYKVMYY